MAQVDPDDDGIERFVVYRYCHDASRHERRHVVEGTFDNVREFESALEAASANLRKRKDAGEDVDPREHISGVVLEPGHRRKQRTARIINNAAAHGAVLDPATWDRLRDDLPAALAVLRSENHKPGDVGSDPREDRRRGEGRGRRRS